MVGGAFFTIYRTDPVQKLNDAGLWKEKKTKKGN